MWFVRLSFHSEETQEAIFEYFTILDNENQEEQPKD